MSDIVSYYSILHIDIIQLTFSSDRIAPRLRRRMFCCVTGYIFFSGFETTFGSIGNESTVNSQVSVFNPIHCVVYVDVYFVCFLKEYVGTGIYRSSFFTCSRLETI